MEFARDRAGHGLANKSEKVELHAVEEVVDEDGVVAAVLDRPVDVHQDGDDVDSSLQGPFSPSLAEQLPSLA